MENYLPFKWDWVRVVVVYSLTIFAVSSAILIPSLNLLRAQRLSRMPIWLRWVLVLPTVFFAGYISETIPRLVFATIEIIINHQLTFKPGVDCLIWQAYSPLFFVIGGMKMVPSHLFGVFVALGGLKITVAIVNMYNIIAFTNGGGEWDRLDPILNSPLWWNTPVYVLCIFLLVIFGVLYLAAKSHANREKEDVMEKRNFLQSIVQLLLSVYMLGVFVSAAYFNWTYARDNGFVKWLLLDKVVFTAKALVWPFFVSRGSNSHPPNPLRR